MTDKPNNDTADLGALYQKRKSRIRSSASDKRKIMEQGLTQPFWQKWFNGIGQVAIAASTVLLIGLLAIQQTNFTMKEQKTEFTVVELHSLDTEEQPLSENVRQRYAQHYNSYLKQQALFARHHKKAAIISQFDDGWELTTCDKELVKISDELVNALYQIDSIESSLKPGDSVEITFDKSGIILGISRSKQVAMC